MNTSFYVVPDDTLWLRSGEPFVAGESDHSGVLFPPSPWSWQGMVRTRLLVAAFGDALAGLSRSIIEARIGPPDRLPLGWRLSGPLPARELRVLSANGSAERRVEPWVPWPLFLSEARDHQAPQRVRSFGPSPEGLISRKLPGGEMEVLAFGRGGRSGAGWISASNLCWALFGQGVWDVKGACSASKSRSGGGALPPFVRDELRPGVAVTRASGRALDSMLYTAAHHRFAPGAGLWGALDGAGSEERMALSAGPALLGRRERTVTLEQLQPVERFESLLQGEHLSPLVNSPDSVHLRVVLLSPAIAEPSIPTPFSLPRGARLRAVQTSAGPAIGGFDRVGGGGRPVRGTWAAGSSFWVEVPSRDPDGALDDRAWRQERGRILHHLGGLSSNPTEEERFGFGLRVAAPFVPETGLPLSSEPPHA